MKAAPPLHKLLEGVLHCRFNILHSASRPQSHCLRAGAAALTSGLQTSRDLTHVGLDNMFLFPNWLRSLGLTESVWINQTFLIPVADSGTVSCCENPNSARSSGSYMIDPAGHRRYVKGRGDVRGFSLHPHWIWHTDSWNYLVWFRMIMKCRILVHHGPTSSGYWAALRWLSHPSVETLSLIYLRKLKSNVKWLFFLQTLWSTNSSTRWETRRSASSLLNNH